MTEISGDYHAYNVLPSIVQSHSNQLRIAFTSDEWSTNAGFIATIKVEEFHNQSLSADDCSIKKPCQSNQGHCQSDDECKGDLKCGNNNCPSEYGYSPNTRCCYRYCSKWLDMENGIITSPRFPEPYPRNLKCSALITVGMTIAGPRTITLEFLHFKVSDNHQSEKELLSKALFF